MERALDYLVIHKEPSRLLSAAQNYFSQQKAHRRKQLLVIHGESSQIPSRDTKLLPSKERSIQEEVIFSHTWRVLPRLLPAT
jgi:hypothetical protein